MSPFPVQTIDSSFEMSFSWIQIRIWARVIGVEVGWRVGVERRFLFSAPALFEVWDGGMLFEVIGGEGEDFGEIGEMRRREVKRDFDVRFWVWGWGFTPSM